ncbi:MULTISPECIES: STAS domain-containing protein [Pasteurellaceae]|uniref:STAS domain-containing protein n=1 Tax=Pasteurella atlantica TaxID=2827233 RepID=A0AAW8CSN4_9PAST|nr:STAS domain-containing protein [Pasteurella atlantica]MBR0573805.1 STAS domain-containing protein [Pasteurella atlantica]MDP8039741.1 STAS domain-containing protein [Pasteurella atlantica]MDP8041926.1 STAS domain-containing protein [Pasteurella atlantica]MDP8044049.1 STAS domain-containing protein [Pasteurella atlantica]MDP8046027.1 STAS domain-containing protein [Pasteurella atlantica]
MKSQKILQWNIQVNNDGLVVVLSGNLTRNTLFSLWEQRASFLQPELKQCIYWDLEYLKEIDSAGFTLLMELLHFYAKNNKNYIINVPNSITNLAQLFDLQEWLEQFTT